jgi:peptide-methionine (S)-S-oxide reductase
MRNLLAGLVLALVAATAPASAKNLQTAIFAGGCFWCVESDYDKIPGVVQTVSGYTGGTLENPTYEQVSAKGTGHYESVKITFDADRVSYDTLLDVLWRSIDPTDAGGQFCDRGDSYRSAVFVSDKTQQQAAEASRNRAQSALGQKIVTPVLAAATFWPAEDYHQNYHNKNPLRYTFYRKTCGRDKRVRALWGERASIDAGY